MILTLMCVEDKISGVYNPPQFFINEKCGIRDYTAQFNKPGTTINQNPQDYRIHIIGRFDDSRGSITPLSKPKFVCEVKDLIKSSTDKETFHVRGSQPLYDPRKERDDNA